LQYYTASNAQLDNREQLKAVVTNSNNVIIVPDDISKPGAQVIVAPIFQNFGGTRTKYFKAHASLKYFEGGVPNNLDPSKPYLDFQAGETIVGPNITKASNWLWRPTILGRPKMVKVKFCIGALRSTRTFSIAKPFITFAIAHC
jgi:hypothetical protein